MMFNALPNDLRDPSVSTATFGQLLKTQLFSAYQHGWLTVIAWLSASA